MRLQPEKMKSSMRTLLFFVLIVACHVCMGQTFVAEAELPAVDKDGFYNISLSPETSQYLNEAFTNIRILDDKNKEVPYLMRVESPHNVTEVFRDYSIIEKKQTKNRFTTIVLHNPDQRLSNNMHLVVKNADVTKEATLLGSDDKVNWFALNQHFVLTPAASREGTSEIKIVNFPLSNYQYYSLQIDDSTSAPLNILTAGYFEVQTADGGYAEVPVKEIVKTDSASEKKSYVRVRFGGNRTIDRFDLTMKGAPFYLRHATVFIPMTRKAKGQKPQTYYAPIQQIEISSKRPTSIELSALRVKELLIVIDNKDNPPLEVDKFSAYQLNRYLTAWLKAGSTYSVKVGKPELAAPAYDISFFKDSIPESPGVLQLGAFKLNSASRPIAPDKIFTTKTYIWVAVIAVIVILGFMSVRLLNEAGRDEKS